MNVKLIKLSSGEEFIAEVLDELDDEYQTTIRCKNMVKLGMTEKGVAFVPFNPLIPDGNVVGFNPKHVSFITEIVQEFENAYKQNFGGIVAAPSKLLTSL